MHISSIPASSSISAEQVVSQARSLRQEKRYEEALAMLSQSLKVHPNHPATLSSHGLTLEHLGRHSEALASSPPPLNESLRIRPNDARLPL